MNKRPGHVKVTTEVGYCSFCGRPRNLRREDHQLGTVVRSIVTCETCHRTLSSTISVASPEPTAAEEPVKAEAPIKVATPVKSKAPAKTKPATAAKKPAARTTAKAKTSASKTTRKK